MDKVKWLQQMVEQSPNDAQAHYWLGKELAEKEQWIEAVQSLSSALALCTDNALRMEMVNELSKVSLNLQQQQQQQQQQAAAPNDVLEPQFDDVGTVEVEIEANTETKPNLAQLTKVKKLEPKFKVIDGKAPLRTEKKAKNQITFADVAGLDDLKKTINLRIISPFFNKSLFSKFRKKVGGGVLLYGPPGCGKTFIARATAGECKANFYPVHITDILDPYIGVSEQNLKDIFDKARFQKPSIMFFDEVDTIGYSRSKSSSHTRGVIDTFLMELEGIDTSTDEVLVVAATNTPWDVDNALKRPGRFDRLIFVAPPDEKAREQIFQLKLQGRFAEEIDVTKLAAQTEFFSGADIENTVEIASENVLEEILMTGNERPLNTLDLLRALENQQPSTLEWLRTAKNYVKYANQAGLYNDVEKYLQKFGRRI